MKRYLLLLMTIPLLITVSCKNIAAEEQEQLERSIADRLRYETIRPAELLELATLPAEVRPHPRSRFELSPPAHGKLLSVLVSEGQWIEPGTPLAHLQIPSMTDWSQIEGSAQKRLDAATKKAELEAEKLAAGIGVIDAVQTAESEAAVAQMELTRIHAARKAARSSGLRSNGQADLTYTWESAHRGVLTKIMVSEGQSVHEELIAFTIIDTSHLEVMVNVPERLLEQLKGRPRLLWRPVGYPADQEGFILEFSRSAAMVDLQTRATAYYFKTSPDERSNPHFLLGRGGCGSLVINPPTGSWHVPRRAISRIDGRDGVFLENDNLNKPEWVEVRIIGRQGEGVLVFCEVLDRGSRVVTRGAFLLESMMLLGEES